MVFNCIQRLNTGGFLQLLIYLTDKLGHFGLNLEALNVWS